LGWGNLLLYTPVKREETKGCLPTGVPSTRSW